MATRIINGMSLPNIPWEERPIGNQDVVWRSSQNPIIPRNSIPDSNSIFNSAVIAYQGAFVGVFRIDDKRRVQDLYFGKSQDGLKWEIEHKPIRFVCDDPEIGEFAYRYDPRLGSSSDLRRRLSLGTSRTRPA